MFSLHCSVVRLLAASVFGLVTCSACVGAPDDTASLSAEKPLIQRSEQGTVQASIRLRQGTLARGPNDLSVDLQATAGDALPALSSVVASMPAHGHQVSAVTITQDGANYDVMGLDFFMSGRWQVALGVELDGRSDSVNFAVDVP